MGLNRYNLNIDVDLLDEQIEAVDRAAFGEEPHEHDEDLLDGVSELLHAIYMQSTEPE